MAEGITLKRKMCGALTDWAVSGSRKAFMLIGARQTGKTYVLREFARKRFASFVEVNLLEDKTAANVLSGARDTEDFVSRLSLVSDARIIPGQTLIFLDEIQEAPDLMTVVKFLVDDGSFAVALSGSMLGTELKGCRSFPVGYVRIERMHPLDFEEFCWSQGVSESIIEGIRAAYRDKVPLDEGLHSRLIDLFRYYVAIGGMPEVVRTYLDSTYDMGAVRDVASQIVEQYKYDISKYARGREPQVRAIYDAVPSQLDKENKRFRMDALKDGASFGRYADDFAWLVDASVVIPTYSVAEPKSPLGRTAQSGRFKLYESDTGLLLSQYAPQTTLDVIADAISVNFGSVYENAVAQALFCENPKLHYFHSSRKGEVDFIVERDDGSLLPIEVKSGKDYKLHTALNNLLGTSDFGIDEACVLSMGNIEHAERKGKPVWYLPLYMAFCIAEQTSGSLDGVRLNPPAF